MPAIEGRDFSDSTTFGSGDDRSIGGSERKVTVPGHQFCDPQPIIRVDRFGDQIALREVGEESDLRLEPQPGLEQICHLGDDQRRDEQWTGMGFKKFEARPVMLIVSIDVSKERPRVDDQSDEPNSAARISWIRSEISVRPLAPAPAARSRLLPVRPPEMRLDSLPSDFGDRCSPTMCFMAQPSVKILRQFHCGPIHVCQHILAGSLP